MKSSLLLLLTAFFTITAAGFTAKPLWRLGERQFVEWRSDLQWRHRDPLQPPKPEAPVAWLRAPSIDLNTAVLPRADESVLHQHPAFASTSAGPRNKGLRIILAHRDTHFRRLGELTQGQNLSLEDHRGGDHSFQIVDMEVLDPETMARRLREAKNWDGLVLVTCHPFNLVGPAPDRYLIWAAKRAQRIR